MKILKLITLFNLLFLFTSCNRQTKQNEKSEINKIVLSKNNGGKGGGSSQLIITKDSILLQSINRTFSENNKTVKIKIPDSLWNKIMNNLNISDFDLLKSNSGHAQYDGTDVEISLFTKEKKHSIINAEDDKIHFEKIKQFSKIIEDIYYRLANGYGLNGRTFSANIGSVCEETSEPNPCAGYQIYLELKFNEFEVEVTEKEISSCGKVNYEKKYLSIWDYELGDKIKIKKLVYRSQQIIENNLLLYNFSERELIGKVKSNLDEDYKFKEKK